MSAVLGTDTASEVLAAARDARRVELQAAADVLQLAARWAAMHPVESTVDAATVPAVPGGPSGGEGELAIAGPGAPLVAEFCVPELAAALGLTPDAGRRLLGAAVELRYRLPRCWGRVVAGDLPAWKARSIADLTVCLAEETAHAVDRLVAPFAHSIGPVQLGRLVDEAVARHQPDLAEERRAAAAEHRHLDIDLHLATTTGTTTVSGLLDTADALDLEAAVAAGARQLALLGCTGTLDVRRSRAMGEIARRDLTLDLTLDLVDLVPEGGFETGARAPSSTTEAASMVEEAAPRPSRHHHPQTTPSGRTVVLHVHLTDTALRGGDTVGRCEDTGTPVLVEQVRDWCQTAARIVVRPVIDLADCAPADSYEIPDRIRERVRLRDHHCVFPGCRRRATACDCDHIQPHTAGGPTCPCNLAPLCRRHHRLKTHTAWTYTTPEPGTYLWRSPHGHTYLVDPTGTQPLDP